MATANKLELLEDTEAADGVKIKSSRDQLSEFFYRIANHEELFRIGKGFLKEANRGVKSFAFTSTGYKNSQQRAILGLCCFFDQNSSYKIAVISDHLSQGVFGELVNTSVSKVYLRENLTDTVKYNSFHHHFDFIDYSEFAKFYDDPTYVKNFEVEVKRVLDNYDLVFWDIPEMETMKDNPHFHYRISHFYQSMNIIISQNATSGKQVESVKNFFSNYNINLNGVLFDSTCEEVKPKKKKFLGIF